jgi:large subunit ribosomal protein L17
MKHHKATRTLGRPVDQRNALIRSLAVSLIRDEKIATTEAKAKELRPFVEKLVTRARVDSVANRRVVMSRIVDEKETRKLFEIAKRYTERKGGYTRITKLAIKAGNDARKMAVIEFV